MDLGRQPRSSAAGLSQRRELHLFILTNIWFYLLYFFLFLACLSGPSAPGCLDRRQSQGAVTGLADLGRRRVDQGALDTRQPGGWGCGRGGRLRLENYRVTKLSTVYCVPPIK